MAVFRVITNLFTKTSFRYGLYGIGFTGSICTFIHIANSVNPNLRIDHDETTFF